jgi:hypothetical protein
MHTPPGRNKPRAELQQLVTSGGAWLLLFLYHPCTRSDSLGAVLGSRLVSPCRCCHGLQLFAGLTAMSHCPTGWLGTCATTWSVTTSKCAEGQGAKRLPTQVPTQPAGRCWGMGSRSGGQPCPATVHSLQQTEGRNQPGIGATTMPELTGLMQNHQASTG